MIPFNLPLHIGKEQSYIKDSIEYNQKLCGDGPYTQKCNKWIETQCQTVKALLTTSCTHAIELAAILADIQPGDEVIAPSYTFVSTVNPFVLRGATIKFVDIRPDTMNINENLIEDAITERTRAIIPVHYAGVACEMNRIMDIARKYRLLVIEDAAQSVMSKYHGKPLGSIGDFGCFSFHETKNYTMGEGGALLIQNEHFVERAEIIREKGTNRSKFFRGEVDKYTWVDVGSSYLPSELNAAYLFAQLEEAEKVNKKRLDIWYKYYRGLEELQNSKKIKLPHIPEACDHNAHMFYIKCENIEIRSWLMKFLKEHRISTAFHYVPLHSSVAGTIYGSFHGEDTYTTVESEKLLRLPLYYDLEESEVDSIIEKIIQFFTRY
ncbi:dTDP-4-amino-4,6-dideoxygalactose transaminase [Paenibacillaceae bacterium WGS1546]|uniref:dTDP-4-amino-4,6-dideoxygalactose transaminase n=1 Tax=Cohnella sp. WGS1546 TaxID=3366810 RepID=UPI00372CF8C5